MGTSLSRRALALAGSLCALSMSGPALAQDAPDTLARLNAMGFPIDADGKLADSAVIAFSKGYSMSIFQSGGFTVVDANNNDVLSGTLWTGLDGDKNVTMGLGTGNGSLTFTFYARESVKTDVMFEASLTVSAVSYDVNPGILSGVDIPTVNVGDCACWVMLPPICENCPPRQMGGPGCTRRDCDLGNPCAFTVPPPAGTPPAKKTLPAALAMLQGGTGGTDADVLVLSGDGSVEAAEVTALVEDGEVAAPPATGTTYQGNCAGGSEHVALGFLGAALLATGLARRRSMIA
jgi:hypothetical protein